MGLFAVMSAHTLQICDVGPRTKSGLSFEAKLTNRLKMKDHMPRTCHFSKRLLQGNVGNFYTKSSAETFDLFIKNSL